MDFRAQKVVNEDGTFTDVVQDFFDLLVSVLVKTIGDEGLVSPSQNASDITTIQNGTSIGPTGLPTATCSFGTFIYDQTNNLMKVAINDGSGNPIFKTLVLI